MHNPRNSSQDLGLIEIKNAYIARGKILSSFMNTAFCLDNLSTHSNWKRDTTISSHLNARFIMPTGTGVTFYYGLLRMCMYNTCTGTNNDG